MAPVVCFCELPRLTGRPPSKRLSFDQKLSRERNRGREGTNPNVSQINSFGETNKRDVPIEFERKAWSSSN